MSIFCNATNFSSGFLTGFWASFFEFYIIVFLGALCTYGILVYCIKGFGLYKMAKNRSFDNAYLAWIPFARFYLFGKISDDINRHKKIQSSNRVVLLIFSILYSVSVLILYMFIFVSLGEFLGAASSITSSSDYWIDFLLSKANSFLIIITIITIIAITFNILYCIYANNIFKDYVPSISGLMCMIIVLMYFVFSGIFSAALVDSVIFLSISTNKPESLKNINPEIE